MEQNHETGHSTYSLVLVTAASQTEAETIANMLIAEKLAACVSLMPIRSVYTWKGEVCRDEEWQLVIKTQLDAFPILEEKIRAIHSYETPEIIALPILAGSEPYLQWISSQLQ
jgi:periplasmic divalent cation tolerance protein